MKTILLCLLLIEVACATSYAPLDFPAEPTSEQLLNENGLAGADEDTLLAYVQFNWEAAGSWLPKVTDREEKQITSKYFNREQGKAPNSKTLAELFRDLQVERLHDPRRVVDVAIRELGHRGSEKSMVSLIGLAEFEEREWVGWKALASVQEILARIDPAKIDEKTLRLLSAKTVAPLLRDLDPKLADGFAWTLWSYQRKWLSVSFRSRLPLQTRLWLAKAFAPSHTKEAAEVFEEGLQSQDAAIRMAAGMLVRSVVGGSMSFDESSTKILERFREAKRNPSIPMWEILPVPLDRPLVQKTSGGRRDLVWLDHAAAVAKAHQDVWPMILEPLTNEMYYSRIGDSHPMNIGLSDSEGRVTSRFQNLNSQPVFAFHGGLWSTSGRSGGVQEFNADGSLLWECPGNFDCRALTPVSRGCLVYLGYQSMECRDRRGDLIWKTSLKKLNDPRFIVAIDDSHFVVSCGKSIGWLTKDGEYRPILEGLTSAGWIRYHPTQPWIVLDGGDMTAIVFDPKAGRETGRFDLDDGHGTGESRFPFPRTYFPE